MPVEPLDTAVVGVGFIGELHARLYDEHRLTNLKAVVDLDEDRAQEVATEYDVPEVETDIATAIGAHDLDAVTIATPEAHHREPTETALDRDVAVLLEKPIAETLEDARAIGEAATDSSAPLQIGYVSRFNTDYAEMKERIDDGDVGELLSITAARITNQEIYDMVAEWTHPMYYLAVHDIDVLRWYVESEVESVVAEASGGLGNLDIPAVVNTTLRFADGTVGTLETNWGRTNEYPAIRTDEVRVTGRDGYGRLVLENGETTVSSPGGFDFLAANELYGRQTDMYRFQLDHFVDCVLDDEEPQVTWRDGLRSLEVANAIKKSIESGERVVVESE